MTQIERKKHFKYYRGEESCPEEWCGKPEGIIWGAEREIEHAWDSISSGEWDKSLGYDTPRPIEESISDFVVSTAQKFDPWDWEKVAEFYKNTPGRTD